MTYHHVTVDYASTIHQREVERYSNALNSPHYSPEFFKMFDLFEGVYVHRELIAFCNDVKHVFRGAKFLAHKDCKTLYKDGMAGYVEMQIAMPNQPYTIGKLGYANYTDNDAAPPTYMVHSRRINNEKYRASNSNYFSVTSKDRARALANVKKYIRQYTAAEMAPIEIYNFVKNAKVAPEKVSNEWREARNVVRDSDRLYRELKALHEQGYQFLSDEFARQVATWIGTAKAWSEEKARVVPATFVHVMPVRDQQYFDVARVDNIRIEGNYPRITQSGERFTQDDIPQDLLGKLSVLSLVSDRQYVEGVGMRVHETLYWVEGV